jgi:hypothetical protein
LKKSSSLKNLMKRRGEGEIVAVAVSRTPSEAGRDPDPDPDLIGLEDVEDTDQYLTFTMADPIGSILIGLAKDNAALSSKVGLRESHVSIRELTRAFYTHSMTQRGTEAEFLDRHIETVEKRMIDKELSSHLINMSSCPPAKYSNVQTLFTTSQRADVLKLFPSRPNKFSGGTKDGSIDVVEFLSSMTGAQEICKLSRPEFVDMLKMCTTGRAHLLLLEWLGNGDSIENIYYQLGLHFDKRLSAEDARSQLYSFRAAKNSNLADVTAKILDLAGRACTALPPGESRSNLYNMEAVQAMIKCLPPASSALAGNTYSSVSAKLGRAATAGEFSRALNLYRANIDKDIRSNGLTLQEKGNQNGFQKGFAKKGWAKQNKTAQNTGTPTAFAIQSPPAPSNSQGGGQNSPAQHQGNRNFNKKNFNKRGGHNQGGSNRSHYNSGTQGQQHGQQKGNQQYAQPAQGNMAVYCSLCGQHCHTAASGCPYMLDDNGKHIGVMPTKANCTACPAFVSPRLNHPIGLCPYRPTGPFSKH